MNTNVREQLTYSLYLILEISKMLALSYTEVSVDELILQHDVCGVCCADGEDSGGAFRVHCAPAAITNGTVICMHR